MRLVYVTQLEASFLACAIHELLTAPLLFLMNGLFRQNEQWKILVLLLFKSSGGNLYVLGEYACLPR